MIQPEHIVQKAQRLWTSQRIFRDWLAQADLFPFRMAAGALSGRAISDQYAAVKDWIADLEKHANGHFTIQYQEMSHRQLGTQRIPSHVVIDSRECCLRLIGKQRQFNEFKALAEATLPDWPALQSVFMSRPLDVLGAAPHWNMFLAVCRYFLNHPRPGFYLRQLDIPGVDSKFIENHRNMVVSLLDAVLPENVIESSASGSTARGFAQRYGLSYESPLIRLRILDAAHALAGLRDLTVPLAELCRFSPDVDTIFITENKVNGLCFPDFPRAIVIFGLGYGVESLKEIGWLKNKVIYYWGDIDSHGFRILDQLRSAFPQVRSMLMDEATLRDHRSLCVEESDETRHTGPLNRLTPAEQHIYTMLLENRVTTNLRLEQDRIGFARVEAFVARIK